MLKKYIYNWFLIYKLCKIISTLFILLNASPDWFTYISYVIENGLEDEAAGDGEHELTEKQKLFLKVGCIVIAFGLFMIYILYNYEIKPQDPVLPSDEIKIETIESAGCNIDIIKTSTIKSVGCNIEVSNSNTNIIDSVTVAASNSENIVIVKEMAEVDPINKNTSDTSDTSSKIKDMSSKIKLEQEKYFSTTGIINRHNLWSKILNNN